MMMMEQIHQKNILERRKKIMMMIPTSPQKNQNHHIIKNSRKFIDRFFKIKKIKKFKYDWTKENREIWSREFVS